MTNPNKNTPPSHTDLGRAGPVGPAVWKSRLAGTLPLPVLVGLVAFFDLILPGPGQISRSLVFEPPFLNTSLQIIFLTFTSYLVGYISLKGYLQTGSSTILFLGSGALVWGSVSLLAGLFTTLPSGPNIAISISNTGALVAAICHTSGGILSSSSKPHHTSPDKRRMVSVLSYGSVLLFVGVFTLLCFLGIVPLFFVPGVGQTLLRMVVLGSGPALFLVASIIFWRVYHSTSSRILYWYFLGLGLTGVGLAAVFFGRAPGDPISWTGRSAMFLGGVYFLQSVRTTFHPVNPSKP